MGMKWWKFWGIVLIVIGGLEAFGIIEQHPENLHALFGLTAGAVMLCICDAVRAVKA